MKLRNVLTALLMIIGTTLMAQDKYEQAIVKQTSGIELRISIEGQEFKTEKIKPSLGSDDYSAILKKIEEMRSAGWETWNSSNDGYNITYFLRRKLK